MCKTNSGIYSITSKSNNKRYIGSSSIISRRWKIHKNDLRANRHHCIYLQNHYNKYGEDDLVFSLVEVIEQGELSLNDFKDLLLKKEQDYLNNWKTCDFNCYKIAGSSLGHKVKNSKYYSYDKNVKRYLTYYSINGKLCFLSRHLLEKDAISEISFVKSLSEEELIKYFESCKERPRYKIFRNKTIKNYYFDTLKNKWSVKFNINSKAKRFGFFETEQEAIDRVQEVRQMLKEDIFKNRYTD